MLATDLAGQRHPLLWEHVDLDRHETVSAVLDEVNARYGRGTIGIGQAGIRRPPGWAGRRQHLSPCYTTRWDQLPVVLATS